MGIGSITFSFPHFLMGPYDVSNGGNANSSNICSRRELFTPSTGRATSETEKLLENIPGLDKFRDLAEGECLLLCNSQDDESQKIRQKTLIFSCCRLLDLNEVQIVHFHQRRLCTQQKRSLGKLYRL